jgi:putative CocE/NonD family hydrolase
MVLGRLPVAILVTTVLLLAGCAAAPQPQAAGPKSLQGSASAAQWVPQGAQFDNTGSFSRPLSEGIYTLLPVEVRTFPSVVDGSVIQTAVWRPDVPAGVKVPVIIDAGPYFGDEIENALGYVANPIIQGLVPHGYAWAQVAVRGTSGSGGCQEFFSQKEQDDIDAAVTYYGTQEWSNGNVALIGISYDGTTTWISAQYGNPHLKTIVPIAGLTSIYDHSFRNGTPWFTAAAIHANYWAYGFQHTDRAPPEFVNNAACPEMGRAQVAAMTTIVTGDRDEMPAYADYWTSRDFKPKILENYKGSVFLVTGILDWRVPPYLAFPFMQEIQAKGLDTKMLLGYWWHDMPDSPSGRDPQTVRWDWAEMLLRWFDKYLKEIPTVDTGPAVIVEDTQLAWRTEENWPPTDAAWTPFYLGTGTLRPDETANGEAVLFGPASAHRVVTERLPAARDSPDAPLLEVRATTGPLEEDLRFAGLPRLHVTFAPSSPMGARIYAELLERDGAGVERYIAHAVMDLRYYEGGYESHTLTPNQPILAKMEFLPVDANIPKGHELVLSIGSAGYSSERLTRGATGALDQWWESPTPLPVRVLWGGEQSILSLPIIERDVGDGRYPGQPPSS